MFLILIIGAALIAFAAYLGLVGLVIWWLTSVGLLKRPWMAAVLTPLLMILWPATSMWQDRVRADDCIALNGPYELSCTGELGGASVDFFKLLIILFSLVGGPLLGWRLARRRQQSDAEKFK